MLHRVLLAFAVLFLTPVAHAVLDDQTLAALAWLENKVDQREAKIAGFEASLAAAESLLAEGQAELAAADPGSPEEQDALEKIADATADVAKFTNKLAISEAILAYIQKVIGKVLKKALPATEVVAAGGPGSVLFSWDAVEDADGYVLYAGLASGVTAANGFPVLGATSPYVAEGLPEGTVIHAVVAALASGYEGPVSEEASAAAASAASPYDPPWADVAPLDVLVHDYDGGLTEEQNAAALAAAIAALTPGDQLLVSDGVYTFASPLAFNLQGTELAPIRIEAAPGATPVLQRGDTADGLVRIGGQGADPEATDLALRGFEIIGGDIGVRLYKCERVWIDSNDIHSGGGGVRAADEDTAFLHITRNDIHDTVDFGEGVRLGTNTPNRISHDTIVALNTIHDTKAAIQGDGIDIKWRSHSNWIVENVVYKTNYPCIFFHETGGFPQNLIERNICFDSGDNVMQAEGGEAIVRNNLLIGPAGNKLFDSTHNQETLKNLVVTHNTMFGKTPRGAGLFGWDGQENMVFANNVIYVEDKGQIDNYTIAIEDGEAGGLIAGNVIFGAPTENVFSGFTTGAGLTDFADIPAWNYQYEEWQDALPWGAGALIGKGDPDWAALFDLTGAPRTGTLEPGCLDGP